MFEHRIRRKRLAHCVGGCVAGAVLCPVLEDNLVSDECDERFIVNYIVAEFPFHLYPLAFLKEVVV